MQPRSNIAFKEWAAVCAALDAGEQTLIVRKGGIHEGHDGFRVAHSEFWLFPTHFHEDAAGLSAEGERWLARSREQQPPAGQLWISNFVVVQDVFEIKDETLLPRLTGRHCLSDETLHSRFHYRTPGLYVLSVRTYRLPTPIVLAESPHFAGCRSWVDLPTDLETAELVPVLDDATAEQHRQELFRALTPVATV